MKYSLPPFLIGSTFSLSLIRRHVSITPHPLQRLKDELQKRIFVSFWGHQNTLQAACTILGANIEPRSVRPAIQLDDNNFPILDGQKFTECWVLSPDYIAGFRPEIGEEVSSDKIIGWQVLQITWN